MEALLPSVPTEIVSSWARATAASRSRSFLLNSSTEDGLKLSLYVRNRWPPIEIIIVSGHRTVAAEEMPNRGLFFSKPYSRHAITGAMRTLVC